MKVAVVGSRNSNGITTHLVDKYLPESCKLIISGGAIGIDSLAKRLAKEKNISFLEIKPDYTLYGPRAPLVRNTQIVKKADLVLAFWDYVSRGTAHAISECIRLNIPFKIISIR